MIRCMRLYSLLLTLSSMAMLLLKMIERRLLFAQHFTAAAQQGSGHDVIFTVDHQLAFSVNNELEEIEHITRIQCRGIGCHQRCQIAFADDMYAVFDDRLARL